MNVLDLFSGIGGFSLGLERAGFKTVAFCEVEPFCQKVLRKHWPDVPIYDDVRELTGERLQADGIESEVITAGFPCQDFSVCGKRAGLAGQHSGLWTEVARLVREIRPKFVVLENTPGLLVRGMDKVCADLADVGYDAEWEGIPAAAIDSPQYRARQWVVAYPSSLGNRLEKETVFAGRRTFELRNRWTSEPNVGRVANGVPMRVDRLKGLGNAVVPQIPEMIGRAIMAVEQKKEAA